MLPVRGRKSVSVIELPSDIPAHAVPFLQDMGYLDPDPLEVGQPAADLELTTLEGKPARLSALWATAPVVLVFGSYT